MPAVGEALAAGRITTEHASLCTAAAQRTSSKQADALTPSPRRCRPTDSPRPPESGRIDTKPSRPLRPATFGSVGRGQLATGLQATAWSISTLNSTQSPAPRSWPPCASASTSSGMPMAAAMVHPTKSVRTSNGQRMRWLRSSPHRRKPEHHIQGTSSTSSTNSPPAQLN
jgi:hypothetical protein